MVKPNILGLQRGQVIAISNYIHYMNLFLAFGDEGSDAFNTRATDRSFLNAVHSRRTACRVVTVSTVK